jgi:hypothetical protein
MNDESMILGAFRAFASATPTPQLIIKSILARLTALLHALPLSPFFNHHEVHPPRIPIQPSSQPMRSCVCSLLEARCSLCATAGAMWASG